MSLEVGSTLGSFKVTALIGEGGMGQVYQATDSKLNRQVALKILREAFASDPGRLARFQREAQVLASLKVLAPLSVDKVALRRYGTVNYSRNSTGDLCCVPNVA